MASHLAVSSLAHKFGIAASRCGVLASAQLPTTAFRVSSDHFRADAFATSDEKSLPVVFVTKEDIERLRNGSDDVDAAVAAVLAPCQGQVRNTDGDFFGGKSKQTAALFDQEGKPLLLAGLGAEAEVSDKTLRDAATAAVQATRKYKKQAAHFVLPALCASVEKVDAVVRAAALANHEWARYKTQEDTQAHFLSELRLLLQGGDLFESAVERAAVISEATVFARELGNEKADVATPGFIEGLARDMADTHGDVLKFDSVVGVEELNQRGLHLIAQVGQACQPGEWEPRIVTLEYNNTDGASDAKTLALVGKGITFDTGGLQLKVNCGMEDMHADKCGAVAVLGAMKALASLRPKCRVVAALALAENSIGSRAYKPYTIVPTCKGTVRIGHTDAEGRLAMASAFTHVQQQHAPVSTLIDVATLTGACVRALGETTAGVFSTDDELAASLIASSKSVDEPAWRLPLFPEHVEALKCEEADFSSTGKAPAPGASTAAAFLSKFVDEGVSFAHIDIAGPSFLHAASGYKCRGATGYGVQLLVDYVLAQASE